MEILLIASLSAAWLGILTSISPCPLATNIAAISFIGKRVSRPRSVLFAGLLYTLGRMLAYVALAFVITFGLGGIPAVANFLQDNMNFMLGPILLVVGVLLLELISIPSFGGGPSERFQSLAKRSGLAGAALLGVVFALSFCPVSAALYFGSLIPLALKHQSSVLLPALYGIGTALPVVVFAFILAYGANKLGRAFDFVTKAEVWLRKGTGALFMAVGLYYIYVYWL